MQNIPPGWSTTQLNAFNDLEALFDAFTLVKAIIAATGESSAAGTPAARVRSDILAMAQEKWATVKTYPPAP